MDRLFLEVLPRLDGVRDNYTRAVSTSRRRGDNVMRGYIELVGNAYEKYNDNIVEERRKKSNFPGWKAFKEKV